MTQNPAILAGPSGPQFLTTPDGATAPNVAGDPVDLTGVPLTAAPSYSFQRGDAATIIATTVGVDMTVSGLSGNMVPSDVGRRMKLEGAMEGDVAGVFAVSPPTALVVGLTDVSSADIGRLLQIASFIDGAAAVASTAGPNVTITGLTDMSAADVGRSIVFQSGGDPANLGSFPITAFISPTSVVVSNAAGVIDAGLMEWYVTPGNNGSFEIVGAAAGSVFITNPAARVSGLTLKWRIFPEDADEERLSNTGNDGIFDITAVINTTTVVLANPSALAMPDPFSGDIEWRELPALTDFPPGDPLSYVARLQIPNLNVNTPQPGPMTFANYDPTVPPLVVSDASGLFSKVQRT